MSMSQSQSTNIGVNGSGGENRYGGGSTSSHMQQNRRRNPKNMNGGGTYYSSGPRDNRNMGGSYRGDSRYSHRGSGGSGDGPHNGGSSSYRGGSDYDSQPYHQQSGMTPPEGHVRTGHSSHQSQGNYHHYSQQQHQDSHHHHGKSMDYDSSSRPPRRSSMPHQSDHRTNVPQQTDPAHQHSHSGFSGGGGGGGTSHHYQIPATNVNEVIIVPPAQQQEHPFPNPSGGHAHVTSHFQVPGHAPPAVGIIGFHPNSQPMFGTLALCHIPYGVNPSSVISPAVYTQVIGSGFVTPGLPYPCGFPSPMVPSHPVLVQHASHPQQVQQHYHNAYQPHCAASPGAAVGGMHNQAQPATGEDCMGFDSSAILNPDADAFFPPTFPPENDADEEGRSSPTICNEPSLDTSEIKSDENVTPRIEDVADEDNEEKKIPKKEGGDGDN